MVELKTRKRFNVPIVTKETHCAQVRRVPCQQEIVHLNESDDEETAKEENFQEILKEQAKYEAWKDDEGPKEDRWKFNENEDRKRVLRI